MSDAVSWIAVAIIICVLATCSIISSAQRNSLEASRIERCESDPNRVWIDDALPWDPKCQERKK